MLLTQQRSDEFPCAVLLAAGRSDSYFYLGYERMVLAVTARKAKQPQIPMKIVPVFGDMENTENSFIGCHAGAVRLFSNALLAALLNLSGKLQQFYEFRRIKGTLARSPVNKAVVRLEHNFEKKGARQVAYGIRPICIQQLLKILKRPPGFAIHAFPIRQHCGYAHPICNIRKFSVEAYGGKHIFKIVFPVNVRIVLHVWIKVLQQPFFVINLDRQIAHIQNIRHIA